MPDKTVLVVEDEELLLQSVVAELEDFGLNILTAVDGTEALNQIENVDHLDAVFTDIRLPGLADGWAIAAMARGRFPGVPVLYTTGYAPDPGRPIEDGPILPKPYRQADLIRELRNLGLIE